MRYYEKSRDVRPKLEDFPAIDAERVTDWANGLFRPYLFHRAVKGSVTISCSACGISQSYQMDDPTIEGAVWEVIQTEHNHRSSCPWCGREATVKYTRYIRTAKNMEEYHPIMILTAKNGALYARGYWARKDYYGDLLAKPMFMGTYAYAFLPGLSTAYLMDDGRAVKDIAGPSYGPKNHLPKPHTTGSWCYSMPEDCAVYGAEELEETHLRYIKSAAYIPEPGSQKYYERLVDVLAMANAYPVATELLMRSGQNQLIDEMIYHYRKNAEIINWAAEKPKELLKNITWREFQTATENKAQGLEILKTYVKFKKRGRPEKMEKIAEMYRIPTYGPAACEFAMQCGISITKVDNYIRKQRRKKKNGLTYLLGMWKDTIAMAQSLGYNTKDEDVLYPKKLVEIHDRYAELERERIELEKVRESREREKQARERLDKWEKKYELEACGYRIILPRTEMEIQREGATLRHCVAGYAERHMAGKLTILFLRRSAEPEASLYTIEMQGNELVQIHGYRNDLGQENPRITMAWLIEPWLKWLKRGSPRDGQGRAKVKIAKPEKAEEAKESKTA